MKIYEFMIFLLLCLSITTNSLSILKQEQPESVIKNEATISHNDQQVK